MKKRGEGSTPFLPFLPFNSKACKEVSETCPSHGQSIISAALSLSDGIPILPCSDFHRNGKSLDWISRWRRIEISEIRRLTARHFSSSPTRLDRFLYPNI